MLVPQYVGENFLRPKLNGIGCVPNAECNAIKMFRRKRNCNWWNDIKVEKFRNYFFIMSLLLKVGIRSVEGLLDIGYSKASIREIF